MKLVGKFEDVGSGVFRAMVFGGWLVIVDWLDDNTPAAIYIPDPEYRWGTGHWLEYMKSEYGYEPA